VCVVSNNSRVPLGLGVRVCAWRCRDMLGEMVDLTPATDPFTPDQMVRLHPAPLPVRCAMHGTVHCKGGTSIYVLCDVMPSRLSRAYPVYNSAILPQIINHRALVYVPVRPTSGSHTAQATARTRSRFSWVTVAVWAAQVADEVEEGYEGGSGDDDGDDIAPALATAR
jgi:hypothetical protein